MVSFNIEKGQPSAHFTVTPIDDEDSLGNTSVIFTLENPSAGFKLGTKATSSVELLEDDKKPGNEDEIAMIEFGENFVHISESDVEGFDISMLLEGSVKHTEIVFIDILPTEGFHQGTDYVTDPIATLDQIKLEINPDSENIKFRVIPVNDRELAGSFELKLSISAISDGLKLGTQITMTVKIEEDDIIDPLEINTIAELRNLFENYEGNWSLSNDYYIEGIITSEDNVVSDKTVYIQDATGGIMLVFNAPRLLKKGDKVQLNLKNAGGQEVNGQNAMTGVEDIVGIALGHGFVVEPEIITLEQLHSGDYQGQRVRLLNVSFIDGIKPWLGTHRFSDGNRIGFVTTFASADFSQQLLPSGKVNITGIVGDWNRIQPQHYQQDVVVVR